MPDNSSSKGNGASKRIGNKNAIAKRARCWAAGEVRKAKRVETQTIAAKRNKDPRNDGITPWGLSKDKRYHSLSRTTKRAKFESEKLVLKSELVEA